MSHSWDRTYPDRYPAGRSDLQDDARTPRLMSDANCEHLAESETSRPEVVDMMRLPPFTLPIGNRWAARSVKLAAVANGPLARADIHRR